MGGPCTPGGTSPGAVGYRLSVLEQPVWQDEFPSRFNVLTVPGYGVGAYEGNPVTSRSMVVVILFVPVRVELGHTWFATTGDLTVDDDPMDCVESSAGPQPRSPSWRTSRPKRSSGPMRSLRSREASPVSASREASKVLRLGLPTRAEARGAHQRPAPLRHARPERARRARDERAGGAQC